MSARQRVLLLLLGVLCALLAPQFAARAHAAPIQAGVAEVDATYKVGASAGQYAPWRADESGNVDYGDFDPHFQQGKNKASYGIQSRLNIRAIVVSGSEKLALVKTSLYIPQDM